MALLVLRSVVAAVALAIARGDVAVDPSFRRGSKASSIPGIYTVQIPTGDVHEDRVVNFVMEFDLYGTQPSPDESHLILSFLVASREGLEELSAQGFGVAFDGPATEELRRHEPSPGALAAHASPDAIPGFPCYRNLRATFALIDALVERASAIPSLEATRLDIGDSYEKTVDPAGGHDVLALRVTGRGVADRGRTTAKGVMYVTCGVHAREYAPPELCARWAEALVDGYGTDAQVTSVLDHAAVYIVLQANPDGRAVAEADPSLYWRKNTRPGCPGREGRQGVDLNRNFPFQWGQNQGASRNPCAQNYRGPGPESEPEVQALTAHMRSVFPEAQRKQDPEGQANEAYPEDIVGVYLDIHAYGDLIIWPWSYVNRKSPNDEGLQAAARKLRRFNGYALSGPETPDFLYKAVGVTDEFAYGELGACGLVYEIGTAFYQDCAAFDATIAPENLPSLTYLASISSRPFTLAKGPDVTSVQVTVEGAPPSRTVTFVVRASDGDRSAGPDGFPPTAQNVARVELTLDMHPADRQDGAPPVVLQLPVPGNAGTTEASVAYAVADLAHYFPGPTDGAHVAYAWAVDGAGHAGPVAATAFAVPCAGCDGGPAPSAAPSASSAPTRAGKTKAKASKTVKSAKAKKAGGGTGGAGSRRMEENPFE